MNLETEIGKIIDRVVADDLVCTRSEDAYIMREKGRNELADLFRSKLVQAFIPYGVVKVNNQWRLTRGDGKHEEIALDMVPIVYLKKEEK